MTLTISPPTANALQATRSEPRTSSRAGQPGAASMTRAMPRPCLLGSYLDPEGSLRQVVALPGARGSVLVVDRDAATLGDRRLVAHLAADEPPENAAFVCDHYLRDQAGHWCRRVVPEDLEVVPFAAAEELDHWAGAEGCARTLTDMQGRTYCLQLASGVMTIPELRWHRRSLAAGQGQSVPISIRDAIAGLESYEPVRTLTCRAIARYDNDPAVSIALLRAEHTRAETSQIVLNRGLRRAVLATAAAQDLSMSEIAARCGKVKRDSKSNSSGETSWLARRLGLAPEGGESAPTPWIHTDVLALIARWGLGISPREVELG